MVTLFLQVPRRVYSNNKTEHVNLVAKNLHCLLILPCDKIRSANLEDNILTDTMQTQTSRNPLLMRLVFLILLILLLFGVNLLYPVAANWNTVQTGEAGDLIYAAGFDGFEDEWQLYDGRLYSEISDGVLRLGLETPGTIYSASSPVYADFDVTVTTRAIAGEEQNDGYGIIFRLSETANNQDCLRDYVTLCQLEQLPLLDTAIGIISPAPQAESSGSYLFLISNDGYYQILRRNSETGLVEEVTIWHNSNGLLNTGMGAENRIRVVGQGNQFQFFLNGDPALLCIPNEGELPTGNSDDCLGQESYILEDDSYSRGKLGVVVNGASMAGDIVEFDNFTVTIPDEILIEGGNA